MNSLENEIFGPAWVQFHIFNQYSCCVVFEQNLEEAVKAKEMEEAETGRLLAIKKLNTTSSQSQMDPEYLRAILDQAAEVRRKNKSNQHSHTRKHG
jgi:hypothetical protein